MIALQPSGQISRRVIHIDQMHLSHHGVTEAKAQYYAEVVNVCMHRHHDPPSQVVIEVERQIAAIADLHWTQPTSRQVSAHGNITDATESAGYALALAAIGRVLGLYALGRAPIRSGSDYLVSNKIGLSNEQDGELDFEDAVFRFEVSASDMGDRAEIQNRIKTKLRQLQLGESTLPGYAGVVGLKQRLVMIEKGP